MLLQLRTLHETRFLLVRGTPSPTTILNVNY